MSTETISKLYYFPKLHINIQKFKEVLVLQQQAMLLKS